jgi:hypothetical protein
MNTFILIIVLQVIVITLTGCSMFEEKMEQLRCDAPVDTTLCAGWKV